MIGFAMPKSAFGYMRISNDRMRRRVNFIIDQFVKWCWSAKCDYEGRCPTVSTNKQLMSIKTFAQEYGVGLTQAYAAANRGEIPAIRIGKRLWIYREALERKLLGSHTTPTKSQA
jgi:Helix-turn-helix domain